jgi:hypothetical protein
MAVSNAIARAAGAPRRVLIGVPLKDMRFFGPKWPCNYRLGVKLVTPHGAVNAARHHDWVMKVPFANNPANTAGAGQGVEAQWAGNDA